MTCPICESEKSIPLFQKGGRHINHCLDCEVAYQVERDTASDNFYSNTYYSQQTRDNGQFINWVQSDEINRKLDTISKIMPNGRLLDIGCGYGYFLWNAKQRGYQIEGMEPNNYSIGIAKKNFGLDIIQGRFGQTELISPYDIITAFHVIEHVPNPVEFIQLISGLLRPGGIAMIETPNFKSINSRRQKADWPFILPDEHLTYFSFDSLRSLLERNELNIINKKNTGPFIHNKSDSLQGASNACNVSYKFKLLKRLYYFASENFKLGDYLRIIAQKHG